METKQRKSFEQWLKTTGFYENAQDSAIYNQSRFDVFDINNGFYRNPYVQLSWETWQSATAQSVPEGFVLVPKADARYFSHDFNGDGFKYHDTLDEAKKEAEGNLDWYSDQVADGRHVNDMGEFNELSYGLVIGSAEYSIDHVVTQDDIDKGEYSYEVGTEILSLYLSEPQEQSHE